MGISSLNFLEYINSIEKMSERSRSRNCIPSSSTSVTGALVSLFHQPGIFF